MVNENITNKLYNDKIMTKESSKENKPAGFKTLINVLRPIRDWLKSTPPLVENHNDRSSVAGSSNSSSNNNNRGSSATINSHPRSTIEHTNHLLGGGTIEYNTHLMRQQQLQLQQLYSQPNYRPNYQPVAPPPPPPPRPAPIVGNQQGAPMTPTRYYSTTPVSVLNSNTSSTPINSSNTNNSSSFGRNDRGGDSFVLNNVTLRRHTPTVDAAVPMDDINGSLTDGVEEQFKRTAKARMSLPIMQQNKLRRQAYMQLQKRGQQQAQSLGHIYLQHKGETKQANLPNELTALDTIRALFVCAFPNMLTMEYMSQPHVKIYIYNPSCNIFYELCDIDDVKHESVIRIHQSDPIPALAQQYHRPLMAQQVPPPKPRRMIPVDGLQPSPNVIYGLTPQNSHSMQFYQELQQIPSQASLQLQPINSQSNFHSPQAQIYQRRSVLMSSQQ